MGFFGEFNTWLTGILGRYIADNTAAIARILEPAIVTLGVFYVVIWGYLQLVGKIEEPFTEGVKRLLTLALILGLSLHLWLYNEVIVDTFFDAPTTLAGGIIAAGNPAAPAFNPVGVADEIFFDGDDAASLLMQKGEIFGRDIIFYFAAVAVYIIIGLIAVYTMFLLALSKIALSVLIAMGPIFMALLFFESTKKFFEAWIAQLCNYAFLTILTVLVAALMLHVVTVAAQAAAATGGSDGTDSRAGGNISGCWARPHVGPPSASTAATTTARRASPRARPNRRRIMPQRLPDAATAVSIRNDVSGSRNLRYRPAAF